MIVRLVPHFDAEGIMAAARLCHGHYSAGLPPWSSETDRQILASVAEVSDSSSASAPPASASIAP